VYRGCEPEESGLWIYWRRSCYLALVISSLPVSVKDVLNDLERRWLVWLSKVRRDD